jgi:hypothetical protein
MNLRAILPYIDKKCLDDLDLCILDYLKSKIVLICVCCMYINKYQS